MEREPKITALSTTAWTLFFWVTVICVSIATPTIDRIGMMDKAKMMAVLPRASARQLLARSLTVFFIVLYLPPLRFRVGYSCQYPTRFIQYGV